MIYSSLLKSSTFAPPQDSQANGCGKQQASYHNSTQG
jgi:hypothetical protein